MVSFSICKVRKDLIKNSFLVLSLAFILSCSESSNSIDGIKNKDNFNWSLVTAWPKNYPGVGMAPERLAKLIKEMSDGRLNITVYGAGEIVLKSASNIFMKNARFRDQCGTYMRYLKIWRKYRRSAEHFLSICTI